MVKRPLSEQVIVITGASSGVGRAVARLAGERGSRVVCAGRNGDGLAGAVREVEQAGGQAIATGRPKPVGSPDNLFHTLPGDPGAHGRFGDHSRSSTAWTTLRTILRRRPARPLGVRKAPDSHWLDWPSVRSRSGL